MEKHTQHLTLNSLRISTLALSRALVPLARRGIERDDPWLAEWLQ
jgi:hypothetical protein